LVKKLKEKTSDRDNSMFNSNRLFKKISEIKKDELSTIEWSFKLSQSLKEKEYAWSCITANNQTEQTLARQSKIKVVQERIVKEFSNIAKVCAELLSQIGFDLHFRLKDRDLQAYQDRSLLPYDFTGLIDNQPRKRRDLSDTDDMGSTNEPIDENDIINEIADDDDNTAPHLMVQSEPNSPLSSGASMHRGVWSAIGSQLAGLAQYAGLTTANQPTSLNELPRKMDKVNDPGAEPAEHARSSKPVSPLTNDSLILANMVASALNDRPIRAVGHDHDGGLNHQACLSRDPLAQSPGIRLLEGARGVASQLHTELNDYVQSLADDTVADIAPYWQPQDLLNIAIVQTAGVNRTSPTKAFLQAVIASPALGVEHESPDNIFRSDGTVRKVVTGADGRSSVFYDSVTGKTTTGSPSIELARCMLRAMAQHQLDNRELSNPLRKQVLDQVLQLQDRRSENSTLSSWLGLGGNGGDKDFRHDFDQLLTEQVGKLHQRLSVNDGVGLNPMVQSLNMGNYHNARDQFINLAPDQQISMIRSLASAPDMLGLDQSSEFIAQLLRDIGNISGNDVNEEIPDWSAFAISQRTWQLFTWLYDCKVTAFDEAFSRQQLSLTISERQLAENDDESWRLNQVITDLLPTKSSASDRASIEPGSDSNLLPPVQCHRFDDSKVDQMLDAYSAIKNQVNANFPRVFADTVSDPLLKQELTGQIATACLEALKGKLTANPDDWQALVDTVINEEFVQFTEHPVV
uniref:hypothetical protein n=1 Tax=Endozoicomonas sp. SESOKO1 TaxID=2828742 RepID=UPI002147FE65